MERKKAELMAKKEELDSREERNKTYFSKVQVIKLDISSKQSSLLEKMEELERLKNELEKLESQRKELMAEFK
jgi:phage terminase large subunit